MDTTRKSIALYVILLLMIAISTCVVVTSGEPLKSEEQDSEKDASTSDDSGQDDSKEKRSREEILFGNQQNKPSGLVDDLMAMSDTDDTAESSKKESSSEDNTIDMSSKDDSDREDTRQAGDSNDMMMGSGTDSWYNTVPVSSSALQYLTNAQTLHTLPSTDFSNSLYDQADLYRRKRQLLPHPAASSSCPSCLLRKRRSLRNSLGQMIQKRGIRMPRRSMRLKRQVDMGDLLNLLDNNRYEKQPQVPIRGMGGWESKLDKKHVPGHFSSYPEAPAADFRYPYTFQHRGDGVLAMANEFEDNKAETPENDEAEDIDSLMLMPPNTRYNTPEIDVLSPYGLSREEETEAFQKWLSRHATPILPVSRRSVSSFYPLDYRYIPGYKKRSVIFSNGNRMSSGYSGVDDDAESDFGKWGHVVKVPEVYASAEDVARLYGLANLMADGDGEAKMRRSL